MGDPKVYKGRGEAAQKTDVPRKKIDAQNSTEGGILRSIVNDYFSVDYLDGVQEYPAQVLRILDTSKEYRNFRETSTSIIGSALADIASAFGVGSKRYIVRVFSVDLGIPAPDGFGAPESRNTPNDAIIDLHAHHEMTPANSSDSFSVGEIVIVKFNNNTERTDGIILRKAAEAPEANGSPSPTNPENFGGAGGQFDPNNPNAGSPSTIGCSSGTSQETSGTKQTPPVPPKEQLEQLVNSITQLETKILEYNAKIEAVNAKKQKTAEDNAIISNSNNLLLDTQKELDSTREQYNKLFSNLNAVELQKQENKQKIEAATKKSKEIQDNLASIESKIKELPFFSIRDTDQQKIQRINLNGEKTFEELQLKVTNDYLAKLLLTKNTLDGVPNNSQQPTPPPPPTPCPPSPPSTGRSGNKKFPTPQERLELIRAVVKGCRSMGFTNTNFIAAVCANIEKETGWKIRNEYDYGGTSAERLRVIFGKRLAQFNDQELYQLAFRNEEFYDYIYGYKTKTLGTTFENTQPGDGYKYRGRGFIGYTGKGLYRKASQVIFKNDTLVKNPDRANEPEINGKFLAYYLSITIPRWEKNLGVNRNNLTPEQACALITSAVGGTNILKAVENEKKAGKTLKDGIWTQIFNKVLTFFPKYVEEASKQ